MTSPKYTLIKRVIKRMTRWVLGIIVLLTALIIIGLAWLSTTTGEQYLLKQVNSQIERFVQEPVTIDQIETNILTYVTLSGITVNRIDSLGLPLLQAKSLEIHYSLPALIFKRITLNTIQLDNCQVWVTLDSSYAPSLPHFISDTTGTPSEPIQWEVKLSEIAISNSQVNLTAPSLPLNTSLQNLRSTIQVETTGYSFSVQGETQLFQSQSDQPTETFDIAGFYETDSITISRLAFNTAEFDLTGKGSLFSKDSVWAQAARIEFSGQPQPVLDFVARLSAFEAPLITGATRTHLTTSGTLTHPMIDFTSELDSMTVVGSPELSGHLSGLVTLDSIRMDTMDLEMLDGHFRGNSVLYLDSVLTQKTMASLQHIDLPTLLAYAYPTPADYAGNLDGSLEIEGPLLDWISLDVSGQLTITDGIFAGKSIAATDLEMQLSDQKASIVVSQGANTIKGLFDNYLDNNIQGSFKAHIPNMAPLTALAGFPQLTGVFDIQGNLSGTFAVPTIAANIKGRQLLYDQIAVDQVELNVKTTGTDWTIIKGQAVGYIPQIAAVPYFPATIPFEGDLHYNVTVAGNIDNLTGGAQLRLSHLKYDVYPADSLILKLGFDQQTITLKSGRLLRQSERVGFTGDFNWHTLQSSINLTPSFHDSSGWIDGGRISAQAVLNDSIWSLSVNSKSLDARLIKPYTGSIQNYSGLVNSDVLITDPLGELAIQGRIALTSPQFTSLTLESLKTQFIFSRQRLTIKSLSAEKNHQSVNLSATIPLDSHWGMEKTKPVKADIKTSKLELSWFKDFLPEGVSADGIVTADITLGGTVVKPIIQGSVGLAEAEFTMTEMPSLKLSQCNFKINQSHIELIRFDGMFADNPIHIQGALDYTTLRHFDAHLFANLERAGQVDLATTVREKTLKGNMTITGVDLDVLTPFLAADQTLTGTLSSQLEVGGSLSSPQINGQINLVKGELKLGETTPAITNISVNADFKDPTITLKKLTGEINETSFAVIGQIYHTNWQWFKVDLGLKLANYDALKVVGGLTQDSLALSVQASKVNLAVFQPFLAGISDLTGEASADMKFTGTLSQPNIQGNLVARRVTLSPDYFDGPFSQGLLKIHFAGNRWQVDSLSLNQGAKGRITLVASVDISKSSLYQIDASVRAHQIKIKKSRLVEGTLESADIQYRTGDGHQNLTGDVVLGRFKYIQRFSPNDIIALAQPSGTVYVKPPLVMQQTRFDIRLHQSDQVWIDNNLANLRFKPEITLIGSFSQPNIAGRVTVQEGYILYLDRKFEVETGILDFTDPHRLNPMINLHAVAHLKPFQTKSKKAYDIFLNISGDLETTIVTLTSDPALDKTDILALLTIGATRSELMGSNLDIQNTTLGRVIQDRLADYSSQKISGYASRRLGTFLGLEEMSIEGNLFNFGSAWGPQLMASKQLSEKTKVTYSTTVGHATDQSIKLDYSITDQVVLETQTDQRGRAGVDLKYRIKFK